MEQLPEAVQAVKDDHARYSFSQLGEDSVLWWLFQDRSNGFYVDVGAHHPFRYSNTAALHLFKGWHGINIDMDEAAVASMQAARPNDINLCLAIGPENRSSTAYFFSDGAVNSVAKDAATNSPWSHLFREAREVTMQTLSAVLDQYLPAGTKINFLNVDAEGLDYEVLTSNNWERYKPEAIAVETHNMRLSDPHENATFNLLTAYGYEFLSHTVVTSIYRLSSA